MPSSFQTSGRSFLLDAKQVDPLAARELHHRHVVLHGDLRNPHQFVRACHPAVDSRHNGERAVLLDVGVDAVIDETRVALVFVFAGPQRFEKGSEADLAGGVFSSFRQLRKDFADRLDSAIADFGHKPRLLKRYARNVVVLGRVVADLTDAGFKNLRHQALARTAAASRPSCRRRFWKRSGSP